MLTSLIVVVIFILIGIVPTSLQTVNGLIFAQDIACSKTGSVTDEICMPISECLEVMKWKNRLTPAMVNYLQTITCGFDGKDPRVCCSNSNNVNSKFQMMVGDMMPAGDNMNTTSTSTVSLTNRDSEAPEDITNHPNLSLLPVNTCGPILTEKLSGGNQTDLFQYPWMVLLEYKTPTGLEFSCGGSLINERYILTAAHCVRTKVNELVSVRLGEHTIDKEIDCQDEDGDRFCAEPVQNILVESVIVHPEYNKPKFANDIALIRISRAANMTPESVRPICLPVTYRIQNILPKRVSITGWGITEKNSRSNELLQASLPIVSNIECQEFYKRSIRLQSTQMCAGGETGIDSCKGDSGGPLVYPVNAYGTQMVQFGIISAGLEVCSSTNMYPGIYVRVSHYMKWLLDQLES